MTQKNNKFGEAIAPLVRAGYPASELLPIIPPDARLDAQTHVAPESRGKNPGRYAPGRDLETGQGTWVGLKGWVNGLREEDRDRASDWPTANVGLLAARFPGLDVDVNSDEARELVMRVAERALPGMGPVRLRGGSPRCLVPYQL
jgi:hypothetical protein